MRLRTALCSTVSTLSVLALLSACGSGSTTAAPASDTRAAGRTFEAIRTDFADPAAEHSDEDWDQSALDDILPAARDLGKSVVAVGVFHSGLLARDRPAEGMKYDYQDAPPALVAPARAIAEVCAAHGTTLPAAAMAFPHTHPSIINVTLGMRTPEQVVRNVELHDQHVPDGLWDDLRTQGLIGSDMLTGHSGGRGRDVSDGQGH